MAIELTDELRALEAQAWAEIQAGSLTVATAEAVHAGIVAHAAASGQSRLDIEAELKKQVRHPEG